MKRRAKALVRDRKLTAEEVRRLRDVRRRLDAESEEIKAKGARVKEVVDSATFPTVQSGPLPKSATLAEAMSLLMEARISSGLSLADINERTGMDRSMLSKLERREDANPTIETLNRIADAMGKKLVVSLVDFDKNPSGR
jgi:ribosome-binding protein aMBF1 (putative translation factor)